jgi:hypothetical protein
LSVLLPGTTQCTVTSANTVACVGWTMMEGVRVLVISHFPSKDCNAALLKRGGPLAALP